MKLCNGRFVVTHGATALLWTSWLLLMMAGVPIQALVATPSIISKMHVLPSNARYLPFHTNTHGRKKVIDHSRPTKKFAILRMMDPSTMAASMALVASSTMGMQLDRRIPGSGILGTLVSAALISNVVSGVPVAHPLYDLCWSWILPASLAMLLLGYKTDTPEDSTKESGKVKTEIFRAISRVTGPFVVASIGSVLGCWAAFRLAVTGTWFSTTSQARAAASCLAASYVGGSFNLFATAKIIQAPASLLSSMATADFIAMALYFSVLSSTLEWKWLRSLFFTDEMEQTASKDHGDSKANDATKDPGTSLTQNGSNTTGTLVKSLKTLPILLAVTWSIVGVANWVESHLGRWIPGTACGVIAIVAPLVRSAMTPMSKFAVEWNFTASTLADWFFLLFFAAIGVGVDLSVTVQMGPACLLVSILALGIHLLVAVVGSKLFLPTKRWGIALEDVWIASNAAIGGPATAAAFCNRIKNAGSESSSLWGRTVAATVWGVVGYAMGTLIGVGLYRFLGGIL